MKNVDTIFALEFGQLLENHLFASPNRDEELEIICSSLNLKSRNQLAQVYAGYDVPTTASIFELIRTLNNAEFIERFFKLKSVNLGVIHGDSTSTGQTGNHFSTSDNQPPVSGQITGWNGENSSALRSDRISITNNTNDGRSEATDEWEIDDDFYTNVLNNP